MCHLMDRPVGPYLNMDVTTYNNYIRIKSFHRLDLAVRLTRAKDSRRNWEFGVYNAYNRANPYYYYLGGSSYSTGGNATYYELRIGANVLFRHFAIPVL
jgi:hypothetical protein